MKKIFSLITALALCMMFAVIPAMAAENGSCGDSVTWSLDGGVLTLSGTGSTTEFTRNGDTDVVNTPWWEQRERITTIVVEEGVTVLDNYCFYACTNVTSVTLPSTLERVETRVFAKCASLTSLTFPKALIYLGYEACVGSGITAIEFQGSCPKVSSTPPLTGLTVAITCDGSADFAATVFGGIITWNAMVPEPEPDDSPDPAEGIDMSNPEKEGTCGSAAKWAFKDGLLLISGAGEMDKYVRNPDLDSVNAPWWDFRDQIKQVVVAKGITRINNYAFYHCENVESVAIPSTVFAINYGAFKYCKALTEVTLPAALNEIGSQAFAQSGLTKIIFQGPIPKGDNIGDLMADGITATLHYPCTEAEPSISDIKIFGGNVTWAVSHKNENGTCVNCGLAESAQQGSQEPAVDSDATEPQQTEPQATDPADTNSEAPASVGAMTVVCICLGVVALIAIVAAIVAVAKQNANKTAIIVLLAVTAVLMVALTVFAVTGSAAQSGQSAESAKEDEPMLDNLVLPETKAELLSFVQGKIQAMENAGKLTNDAMTELFSACDAEGYIHITNEGQSYITAKDGGQIMVSELSSTYVHRLTEKAFKQMIEIAETYVSNAASLEYGNYYTPFNDTTTNHIDCSSFTQLVLYGIPYEGSRYVADVNTARYNFGIALPDNPYRNEFGPYRYLANDLGRYAVDNGFGFYPNEDATNLQPGDVVFFSTNNKNEGYFMNITHVGILVERQEDGILYIVHGNTKDVANYYKIDLVSDWTPLGSRNAYKDSLVLIARFPVQADD